MADSEVQVTRAYLGDDERGGPRPAVGDIVRMPLARARKLERDGHVKVLRLIPSLASFSERRMQTGEARPTPEVLADVEAEEAFALESLRKAQAMHDDAAKVAKAAQDAIPTAAAAEIPGLIAKQTAAHAQGRGAVEAVNQLHGPYAKARERNATLQYRATHFDLNDELPKLAEAVRKAVAPLMARASAITAKARRLRELAGFVPTLVHHDNVMLEDEALLLSEMVQQAVGTGGTPEPSPAPPAPQPTAHAA